MAKKQVIHYTDNELLKDLKEVYEIYGYIGKKTINLLGKHNDTLYYRRFKTLDKAMKLIGIDVEENKIKKNYDAFKDVREKTSNKYPKDLLIKYMQNYINKYGYPTTREFDKKKEYPSVHIYRMIFGSFEQAIIQSKIIVPKEKQELYQRQEFNKENLLFHLKIQNDIKLKNNLYLLTAEEIDSIKEMPSTSAYYKKFKSLKDAYLEIGINYDDFNLNRKKEDMKQKYIEMRDILGRPPHSRDMDKFCSKDNEYYSSHTYCFYFNSIHDLQVLMGDKPRNWSNDLTDEEMLKRLIKLKDELGIVPNQKEVDLCEYTCSANSYVKRFGSFVEAIIKSGMIPRSKKEPLITPKGNRALSGYEYKFMLVLEQYNIDFKKEEFYKKHIKGFKRNYRFDFTLEFNNELFFIEIFGITGNKKYDSKVQEKIQLCKDNKLNLIEFYPDDVSYNSFEEIYKLLNDNINKLIQNRKDLMEYGKKNI